jgi:hypothetical protein
MMKKLLMTTALLTALAGTLAAQEGTPDIMVPEGFAAYEDTARLTFDDLNGATVYDRNGEAMGEISDIVFASQPADTTVQPDTDATNDQALDSGADATGDAATDDMMATDADETGDVGSQTGVDQGVTETDAMVDGVDTTADVQTTDPADTMADPNADANADTAAELADTSDAADGGDTADATADVVADDMAADDMADDTTGDTTGVMADDTANDVADDVAETAEQAADEITDTANEAVEDINEAVNDATESTELADPATTDPAMTDGEAVSEDTAAADQGEQLMPADGAVSHVVLDLGGFLGIGVHTVAVPFEALQVYADGGNRLRIYLPWTEDQLRNLPEYEAGDPSTLGQMSSD